MTIKNPVAALTAHRVAGLAVVTTVIVAGITAGVAFAASAGSSAGGNGNGQAKGTSSENKTFTVGGAVDGLAPGLVRTLTLTLTNNGPQAIKIKTLTVTAADVRNSSGQVVCSAAMLGLGTPLSSRSGSIDPTNLTIAGNATVTNVAFPLALSKSAPNGCKGATWALTYTGSADQV